MGQYNTAVLTTAGQALLTSILGAQGTLTFSKFQTSSYQYASGTDLSALTSLQSVEQEVTPSAGGIKDATTFYSSSTVDNTGVTVEYVNYTVGLFVTDGDDEVLFAVSTAVTPDVIPVDDGGTPSTYTYTMSIGVSSTANITVEVDDQGILRVTSIVDNLTSTSTTQPLSAKQGKVLKDSIPSVIDNLTSTSTTSALSANMGHLLNDKVNFYGVCSTAAATAAKTASTANGDFALETGAKIVVKFTNGNAAATPTLNVDSTGAVDIYQNGAAITEDLEADGSYIFVYNGTQFDLVGGGDSSVSVVDNLRSSSATDALSANQGNKIANDMAEYVLSGDTNTTGDTLTTGTYFVDSTGQLCKVTSDIANNGAITLNTNCGAVSVGEELTALNSNLGSPSSASAVTGTNAFAKINTLNNKMNETISVTGESGDTYKTLLNKLYALIDHTKMTEKSTFASGLHVAPMSLRYTGNAGYLFSSTYWGSGVTPPLSCYTYEVNSNTSNYKVVEGPTLTDHSNDSANGVTAIIRY